MKKFLPVFLTLLTWGCLHAQTDTLFWFAVPEVSDNNASFDRPIVLRISTYTQAAQVTISQPAGGGMPTQVVNIPPGSFQTVDLTAWIDILETKPPNNLRNYGLQIQSTAPVSMYYEVVSSSCQCNPEIFVLKGQNAMGTDFYIPSQDFLDNNAGYTPQPFSSFDIVATQNNTTVTIIPSNAIVGHAAGVPFSVVLNAGQTFSNTAASNLAAQHLMGSRVTSDKPIAITVKDDLLTGTPYGGCADLGGDQIVPTNILGTEYIAMNGFLNSPGDQLFITATQNGTSISQNGSAVTTINAGQTYQVAVGTGATYIQTSSPAYVWQLSGFGCEIGMDVLPPIICTGSFSVSFTRSTTESLFVSVLVRSGGQNSFLVNGSPAVITSGMFNPVPGTGGQWVIAQVSLPAANYPVGTPITVTNATSLFHLSVIHGGAGSGTRFGYFSNFAKIDIHANATSNDVCLGSTIQLNSDTIPLAVYSWLGPNGFASSQQNPSIANAVYPDSGLYIVTASVLGCLSTPDTVPIEVRPTFAYTRNDTMCPNATFTLPDGSVVNTPGTYVSHLSSVYSCDSIITTNLAVASINIDAGNDVAICNGQNTQLNATGGLIYTWTPTTGLSNANIANPVATPTTTTTYTVSTQVPIGNLMQNGNFSAGNIGFSSSYAYTPPPNTSEGQYWVSTNAQTWNGGMASCGDHTSGSGNMLLVNGATTANVSIYCQTVNVQPNTNYAFSTWLMTLSAGNPAQLQFSVNGSLLGSIFTASNSTCIWQQFYTTWNSGANTTATICIVNQNTLASANDFALDDMSFAELCTATDSVTVTVNPVYANTINAAICQNETYTLPDGTTQVNTTGTYTTHLSTVNGCDSAFTTNLTVYPTYSFNVFQTICPSDLYTLPGGSVVNVSGTYIDTLLTVNGCDSVITTHLTVVAPNITITPDTAICFGSSVQLNANGGLYTYTWTPTAGLSDPNIQNPVATPQQTTSYIVATQVASGDLIANGNFSSGNVGFSSSYTYTTNLYPEGTYYVGSNPNTYHNGFQACPDHTSGSGNMMIVNGAGTAGLSVWCETINVVPNTNYAFGCWGESVASGSPAILQFSINGGLIGPAFNVPNNPCQWQQFYAIWNSGANTTANICIVNQNTTTGGNDFAIDDVSFIGLCNAYDTVTITVNHPDTVAVDTAVCQGVVYTFPAGNTSIISVIDTAHLFNRFGCDSTIVTNLTVHPSPLVTVNDTICLGVTYTLPLGGVVNTSGTYIDTLATIYGCDSIVTTNLVVLPPPTSDEYDTICQNQNFVLPSGTVVTTAGTYIDTLHNNVGCDSVVITHLTVHPTSATSVNDTICQGGSFTLPDGSSVNTAGSYPVTLANQYGCDSVVTTVLTVINVSLSVQPHDVLCNGQTSGSINASATGGVSPYNYVLSQGGSAIANNATGNFSGLGAGNYSVQATDDFGCTASANATVNEPAILSSNDTVKDVRCYGESNGEVIITATGGTPSYVFNLDGTNSLNGIFNSLAAGNYTYTVTDAHGCIDTASVTVTQPQAIVVQLNPDSVTLKLSESAPLSVTTNYGPSANYLWTPTTGLSCFTCPNPVVMVYNDMEYHVEVSVNINGNDCYAYANIPVTVIPNYDLFIPNVFTPNGDGNNDVFRMFGNLTALKFVEVEVFNRIGEKVFSSNDIYFEWDGYYKGRPADAGVYVYQIKTVFIDNHTEKLYKGTVTLLR